MKTFIYKTVALFILSSLLAGCAMVTTTTAHVTQPVMLGKVKKVNGRESEARQRTMPFDIRAHRTSLPLSDVRGPNPDDELLKRIDSPDDEVIVDNIWIACGSSAVFSGFGFIPFGFCEVAILGGIYSSEEGDHENK